MNNQSSAFRRNQFNTLGQSRTTVIRKSPKIIRGKGSDLNDTQLLERKAKCKCITQTMSLHLIDIAESKGDAVMSNCFWNTYRCQEELYTDRGRIHTNYCQNRLCNVCNGIRKANFINRYFPIVQQWEDPYFLTLTIRSVPAKKLASVMSNMLKELQRITDKHRKRDERGKGNKLIGIRTLECNFNPNKRTYNPHFHFIVPNKETGEILKNEWLSRSRPGWASVKAQWNVQIFDKEKALIEVIKYGSKIFTEPDGKNSKTPRKIYIRALYNIIKAMRGRRLFASFGFKLPPQQNEEAKPYISFDYEEWKFNPYIHDWYNPETGEQLSNYKMPFELADLLQNNIDCELD